MSWREAASPIIQRVIQNCHKMGIRDEKKIRAYLSKAYPFGERKYWPYKVWLDEIKCQLHPETVNHYRQRVKKKKSVPKEQMELF